MTIRQLDRPRGLVIKPNKKEINLAASFKKLRFEVKNVVYNLGSDKKVTTNKKEITTSTKEQIISAKRVAPALSFFCSFQIQTWDPYKERSNANSIFEYSTENF